MTGIFHIINIIVKDKRVKHSEFRVFMVLVSYNSFRNIFPSLKTISDDSGIKSKSDISKKLHNLEEYGYIKIIKRKHKSNIYEIMNIMKEPNNKLNREKNLEDKEIIIPECLNSAEFMKVWDNWKKYFIDKNKTLSPITENQQLKFLSEQPDPIGVINKSIRNGWKGLFELNKSNYNGHKERRNKQQEYVAKETY